MRMLLKVSIPVEAGNAAARTGNLGQTIKRIVDTLSTNDAFARAHPLRQPGAPASV